MVLNLDEFLIKLSEENPKEVIVATYNSISGYEDSCDKKGENGRTVHILCGGAGYADLKRLESNLSQKTKKRGAKVIAGGLDQVSPGSFVIIYAGKSLFGEMVALARKLVKRDTKVALVSCGCDKNCFTGIKLSESVLCVLPTTHGRCNGGREDLTKIIKRLLC